MLRVNCAGLIKSTRCGKQFRVRKSVALCRFCYKAAHKESRPLNRALRTKTIHTKKAVAPTPTKRKK